MSFKGLGMIESNPKSVLAVRFEDRDRDRLKRFAEKQGKCYTALAREILVEYLDRAVGQNLSA